MCAELSAPVCCMVTDGTGGEPISPGALMPAFTLEDQHGKKHEVNEQVRLILFCKEKKGNDIISDALKETRGRVLVST